MLNANIRRLISELPKTNSQELFNNMERQRNSFKNNDQDK